MSANVSRQSTEFDGQLVASTQSLRSLRLSGELVGVGELTAEPQSAPRKRRDLLDILFGGIKRRWLRERRRRKVGRAYDMALEIARVIPRGAEVLDVGCGNGFIAHHLSALLGSKVTGIDLNVTTDAVIDYRRYDGRRFPAPDDSCDAVLCCYVLHHAQDVGAMLREMRRVLRDGGLVVIYEDIPATWWDRFICSMHNRQWRDRTGPCEFRLEPEWHSLFKSCSFEILEERRLSRGRNFFHPVARSFFVVKFYGATAAGSDERLRFQFQKARGYQSQASTLTSG